MKFAVFVILCALSPVLSARADSSATAYVQTRRAVRPVPLAGAQLSAAQTNPIPYAGKTFDVRARITGFVSADNVRTVLFSVGAFSLAARVPSGLAEARWLTAGQTVRVLLRMDGARGDNLSTLTVLAAAPDADVSALERAASVRAATRSAFPSRSYARERFVSRPVSGGTVPGAPAGLSLRAQGIYAPYWNAVRGMNPRLASADVDKITASILYYSDQNDIDPRLIMAMIICESGFDINSTSRTGAMGLGQLMPSTAQGMGVTNAYDPVQNIAASVRILRGHLDQYGGAPAHAGTIPFSQIALIMAAYNAGPGAVRKYHGVPPYRETQRYVQKVAALYKKMCSQDASGS